MGLNSLTTRAAGETILDSFFNDFKTAFSGDMVGRNSSGVPSAGQNLGTVAIPWGAIRATSLVLNGNAIDTSQITSPANRVISGKVRSTSNQPQFITPNGAALSFVLDGTPTNLVVDINGSEVAFTSDITKSSLTAAPGTNNTALVDDTSAADQHDTRMWGEPQHRKSITIDTVGSEITALVGKWAAFMLNNGSETEYFLAYVNSNTELTKCFRGFFYDSTLAPQKRIVFSNNDTITLLKLGWVFVENDAATVDVSYNNPVWDFQSPSSPVTGDYWYDLANNVWKRYDGASFEIVNRTFVGMIANNTTACVGARSQDFYYRYAETNTLRLERSTTEIVRAERAGGLVSVAGNLIQFNTWLPTWNITTDLAGSADMYNGSEQASRLYYLYIKDTGETVISDMSPYFRDDLMGQYHPHNPWRCVGMAYNNASSNFSQGGGLVIGSRSQIRLHSGNGYGATNITVRRFLTLIEASGGDITYIDDANLGTYFIINTPGKYAVKVNEVASGTMALGITINSPDGTVSATALADVYVLDYLRANTTDISYTSQATFDAKVGDIIWEQSSAAYDGYSYSPVFQITKIA